MKDVNKLWRLRQLEDGTIERAEDAWQLGESALETEVTLAEALTYGHEAEQQQLYVYATPGHARQARSVLKQLRAANESLRKYIQREFSPEELA
jgi:hypothetical protein